MGAGEKEPGVELAGFEDDLLAQPDVAEGDHQRLRRFLAHLDDDAIVPKDKSIRETATGYDLLGLCFSLSSRSLGPLTWCSGAN